MKKEVRTASSSSRPASQTSQPLHSSLPACSKELPSLQSPVLLRSLHWAPVPNSALLGTVIPNTLMGSPNASGWNGPRWLLRSNLPAQAESPQSTGSCPALKHLQRGRLHTLNLIGQCTARRFFMFRQNSLGISFRPLPLRPISAHHRADSSS